MVLRDVGIAAKKDPWGLGLTFAAGASVGFVAWRLGVPERIFNSYLFFNNLATTERRTLVLMAVGGAVVLSLTWIALGVLALRRPANGRPSRAQDILPTGVLLAFVPFLAVQAIETYYVFHVFALVAGLAATAMLVTSRWTRRGLPAIDAGTGSIGDRTRRTERVCTTLLIAFTVAYAAYFVLFTLGRHRSFHSHAFDLGWQQQAFYTLLHSGNPRITLWATLNHFGNHLQPIYYLLAPIYAIGQSAATLVVLQSVFLSTAAIPIYLIARRRLGDPRIALVVAACYLLYPPLHGVNNYDFHGLSLLIPISAFMLYGLETRRNGLFWIMFALGLMTREDAPISLAGVGLYLLLQRDRRRMGILVTAICVVYFILVGVIMTALDGYPDLSNYWALTLPEERSFTGVLETLISNPHFALKHILGNPEKLEYLVHLLLPLAFIPLLSGLSIVLVLPGLAIMLLSNTFFNYSIATPYSSHVIAQLFFLTILGIERTRRFALRGNRVPDIKLPRVAVVVALIVAGVTMNLEFGLVASKRFPGFLQPSDRLQTAYSMFDLIPDDASVATDTRFVPHLSGRTEIRLSHAPYSDYDYVLVDIDAREPAIDTHEAWYRGTQYPGVLDARRSVTSRLQSGDYGVVRFQDGLILLGRGHDTGGNEQAIRTVTNAPINDTPELISYYADPAENVDDPVPSESDHFERMLKTNRRGTVIIAANGGASTELSYVCMKYMMLRGSNIHTLRPGGSYVAVIRNGLFEFEAIDNGGPVELDSRSSVRLRELFPDRDLRIVSSGERRDGSVSIEISGAEHAPGGPGFNAVIVDGRGQVEGGLSYDTGR